MKKSLAFAVALTVALASTAQAQVLTFDGLEDFAAIGNHYNGGAGSNYGIEFSSNALSLNSSVGGCTGNGNFALQSSGCGVLFFQSGASAFMNRAAGFTTGFSLFYSAVFQPGSLQVFDGLNGTGTLLGSLALGVTPIAGAPACFERTFCPFVASGITFAGTAKSVVFSGVADQIAFDDVTFGSATAGQLNVVPEPSTYALMAAGLIGLGGVKRMRQRSRQTA